MVELVSGQERRSVVILPDCLAGFDRASIGVAAGCALA